MSPNFWTDPSNGTPYFLAVQTPEWRVSSLNELKNTPVATSAAADGNPVPGLLSNVATIKRDAVPTNANQANVQPVYEVYANAQGPRPRLDIAARSTRSSPTSRKSCRPATASRSSARSTA